MEERQDGIYAYSNDIAGLNICGENRDDVLSDVLGAVKFIYKEVHGVDVQVELAKTPDELARADSRISPKTESHRSAVEHLVMRRLAHAA